MRNGQVHHSAGGIDYLFVTERCEAGHETEHMEELDLRKE